MQEEGSFGNRENMGLAGGVTLDRALNCCDSQFPFYESEDLTVHLWGLPGK